MTNLPAPPVKVQAPGRSVGIAAIVCGVLGLLFLPVVFGPIAVVLGIVAVSQGYGTAWIGIIFGGVQVAIVAAAFLELSRALESIG